SSRRRHTRSKRDWSSDVCSSDLEKEHVADIVPVRHVQMETFGIRLNAPDFSGQIRQVGGPERGGAFEHVRSNEIGLEELFKRFLHIALMCFHAGGLGGDLPELGAGNVFGEEWAEFERMN